MPSRVNRLCFQCSGIGCTHLWCPEGSFHPIWCWKVALAVHAGHPDRLPSCPPSDPQPTTLQRSVWLFTAQVLGLGALSGPWAPFAQQRLSRSTEQGYKASVLRLALCVLWEALQKCSCEFTNLLYKYRTGNRCWLGRKSLRRAGVWSVTCQVEKSI
jgi:hypothetical protein